MVFFVDEVIFCHHFFFFFLISFSFLKKLSGKTFQIHRLNSQFHVIIISFLARIIAAVAWYWGCDCRSPSVTGVAPKYVSSADLKCFADVNANGNTVKHTNKKQNKENLQKTVCKTFCSNPLNWNTSLLNFSGLIILAVKQSCDVLKMCFISAFV